MDAGNFVDDIAQEVTALHAVVHALKNGGDHVPAVVAVGTGERAQVTEQARALCWRQTRKRLNERTACP